MTAIGNDAAPIEYQDVDPDAFNAFLGHLTGEDAKDKPSKPVAKAEEEKEPAKQDGKQDDSATETATEEKDEASAEKPDAEAEETEEQTDDKEETQYADEGAYVKIKVGDEEHEVPVKDLQRLYGQEKALTQKSMEVADQRKAVDAEMAKNVAASSALLQRAQQRWEPYSKVDFILAAKELSAEDYSNLRAAATAAYEDVQFLQSNLNGFMQAAQQRQHEALVTQAKQSLEILGGPVEKGGIEGFNEQVYNDIRKFGEEAGLSKDVLHNLVDPVAIRLLNDARLYQLGKKASNVVTKKVNKTPKKIVKTSRAPDQSTGNKNDQAKANAAMKRLRATGDMDDAAEAFLGRWAARDADLN